MTRILVVDDSALIRSLLSQKLIGDSFDVTTAKDGLEGVECVQNEPKFDLIISDMIMPNLDGISMLERIYKMTQIPSIVVSTERSDSLLERAKNANVKIWLPKPAPYPQIKEAIQRIIKLEA